MKRFVVLGDPVTHSRSPAIHNAAFAALGIDANYSARTVDDDGMGEAAGEIRHGFLDGANITMPHKEVAFRLCDRVVGEARLAGSVNTWVMEGDRLVGYSTDIPAIRMVWENRGLPDGPVLVLGAGGAAAAALVALTGRPLYVSARRSQSVAALVGRVGSAAETLPWGMGLDRAVVVNCTPLGRNGETLPAEVLDRAAGLFEMAYGADPTPATNTMISRGIPVADGLELLVTQAVLSFQIWHGVPAPVTVMETAARKN